MSGRRFFNSMSNSNSLAYGIAGLLALGLLYLLWPYLVGFLAVVGAAQIYRVWRQRAGR